MFTNRLANLSVRCGLLPQYQALRNQHVHYFDNQLHSIYSFYGNDRGEEESENLDQASADTRAAMSRDASTCQNTANTLAQLRAQNSDSDLDQLIQQSPNSNIAPIRGCANSDSESTSTVNAPHSSETTSAPSNTSEPSAGGGVPSSEVSTDGGATTAPTSVMAFRDYNVGTGALKIIASLYANVPGINRCAPMQPGYIYSSGIQSQMPDSERPKYTQTAARNPIFANRGSELQMTLISSDCSSFASAAIGAGGLKLKTNQEINDLDNMPSTETMMNWQHSPSSNNCFEVVKFNNRTPAIQVGDLYVNRGPGPHVVIITGVASESDPFGFTSMADANGRDTVLPDTEHINFNDCANVSGFSLLGKLARGGNGNYSRISQAQNLDSGPYVSTGLNVSRRILELACRGHFSQSDIPAFAREDGSEFALFRVKHNPDGSILEACKSRRNILPMSYESVRQCFAR